MKALSQFDRLILVIRGGGKEVQQAHHIPLHCYQVSVFICSMESDQKTVYSNSLQPVLRLAHPSNYSSQLYRYGCHTTKRSSTTCIRHTRVSSYHIPG